MFLDSEALPAGEALRAQLCIIGGGAAGITLALELLGTGMDVLLLEAGGLEFEKTSQALYEGEVADERLHSPPDRYRQRRFGGTTTIWGGRCVPYDPIDFELRDYMPYSGWPLDLSALLPFYRRANSLVEAGAFAYRVQEAFDRPLAPLLAGFDSENFTSDTLERFSCPTDFGRRYGGKLKAATNIRVVLHANLTHIQLDPNGRSVESLAVANAQGKRFRVQAQRFVLATGGLEVARLLLASRDIQPSGIGNRHDAVGRYYMCHLAGTIGRIAINGPPGNAWHGYDISREGIYCRRRLALRPEAQRLLRLGNFVARLHHPRITDPAHRNAVLSLLNLSKLVIPYEYAKRLHGSDSTTLRQWLQHVWNVASMPHEALRFAWHMLRDRKLAERKFPSIIVHSKANLYSLDFHAEQCPSPASRVTLSDRQDPFEMPRIRVDWRYTANDVDTVKRSLALLREDIQRSGVGTFEYNPASVEDEMTRYGAYGGHHIGTARMGNDPRTSVVDVNCRVHEVENLYIAGSATFPTSSQANPTLTIVALALRLAAHLNRSHETPGLTQLRPSDPAAVA
jgi:choline dehydrogenase-like flavoprotein